MVSNSNTDIVFKLSVTKTTSATDLMIRVNKNS